MEHYTSLGDTQRLYPTGLGVSGTIESKYNPAWNRLQEDLYKMEESKTPIQTKYSDRLPTTQRVNKQKSSGWKGLGRFIGGILCAVGGTGAALGQAYGYVAWGLGALPGALLGAATGAWVGALRGFAQGRPIAKAAQEGAIAFAAEGKNLGLIPLIGLMAPFAIPWAVCAGIYKGGQEIIKETADETSWKDMQKNIFKYPDKFVWGALLPDEPKYIDLEEFDRRRIIPGKDESRFNPEPFS